MPAEKVWINLKPFIQEAYQCRLNTTNNTTGQHRYVQNAYAALKDTSDEEEGINDKIVTVTTQLAAMTTQSQLTAATAAANVASVTSAINQLAANQMAMMQMMAYANNTRQSLGTHGVTTSPEPNCDSASYCASGPIQHSKLPTRWTRPWWKEARRWLWRRTIQWAHPVQSTGRRCRYSPLCTWTGSDRKYQKPEPGILKHR